MQQPQRQWKYATGKITLTDHALKVDYATVHKSIALSEIIGVERSMGAFFSVNLVIKTRGQDVKLAAVAKKVAEELTAALGF